MKTTWLKDMLECISTKSHSTNLYDIIDIELKYIENTLVEVAKTGAKTYTFPYVNYVSSATRHFKKLGLCPVISIDNKHKITFYWN